MTTDRTEYYRAWKKGPKKRLSDKYYNAAAHANRRAERWGVPGRLTTADVRAVLHDSKCTYCGTDADREIDHRIPMAEGGPNVPSNLVPSCHSCNSAKSNGTSPTQWSIRWLACVECGTTDQRHEARGLCKRCWSRNYDRTMRPNRGRKPRTLEGN